MDYSKDKKYFKLDDILKLNLSTDIKKEIETKFNKRIFYDSNGSCKLGILIGIKIDPSETYYIVDINGNNDYVPIWKSIAKV